MSQDREAPRFQGIADPRCRCTPDRVCRWCCPPDWSDAAISYKTPGRFLGKFREPWNAAVKKNNLEVKSATNPEVKNGGE